MRRTTLSIAFVPLLALVGCPAGDDGDDDGAATSSTPTTTAGDSSSAEADASSTGTDPFADCDRGTLEADLMGQDGAGNPAPVSWAGPGVDPETGMLVDDGSTYVVSSTYLAMKPDAAAQQAFGEVIGPIVPELFGNPGVVAVQLGTSMQCASARTFTVWQDEAAMMAFVMSDAHVAAVVRIGEMSRGMSVVTHWTGAAASITWEDALAHVLADEGPFY